MVLSDNFRTLARRSEEPRHKSENEIYILWHSGLLDKFLYQFPKTTLKNTRTPLYSILKLTFLKIFKNKGFGFLNFLKILFYKSFHFVAQWASWHVSLSIPKNRTQKYLKLTSLYHFDVDIPGNLKKWKFLFFSVFSKFCFPTYAWVPQIASHTFKEIFEGFKL